MPRELVSTLDWDGPAIADAEDDMMAQLSDHRPDRRVLRVKRKTRWRLNGDEN